jgi:hypothetical protein
LEWLGDIAMAGYTPVFDSLTKGTLCGRWPDIGLWPIILSMSDRDGIVDVTPLYIAGVTGLSEQEIVDCMARFCQPDKYSRSQDCDGCRLELLDDHRDWGWKIINHAKYREKARLTQRRIEEVASGKAAEKQRKYREAQAKKEGKALPAVTRSYPKLPHVTPSDPDPDPDNKEEIPSVSVVFDHWKKTFGHPKAQLDDKRRKRIKARLKDYTEADLIESISGYLNSPHHMGENSNCTRYDSIELFLRDAAHVDAGLAFTKGLVGTPDKAKKEAWDQVIHSLKNSGAPRPTDPALVKAVKICGGWQAIGSANIENVLPRIKKQFMEVYGE